ncbi:MAG: hypothetical protein HC817_02600 [Saprospiraceae bacterium]|nr:hypothetical protein [Saprospiraceae bacterium]
MARRYKSGGCYFSEKIKIETVKPNRLKINLDFGKKEVNAGEDLAGNMQINWLHGAPARNVKVKIDASLFATKTEFPKFKDFVFDNPTKSGKTDPSVFFDNNVDANGFARVVGKLPSAENASGKMKVGLKIRAFESGGDFSSDYQTLDYSPFQTYVGISIPKNKEGEKRADINRKNAMSVVVVDKNGNPLRNRSVEVKAYRVEWRWWWETGEDSEADFTSGSEMKSIFEQKLTTDNNGIANFNVNVDKWGRYAVLRATL